MSLGLLGLHCQKAWRHNLPSLRGDRLFTLNAILVPKQKINDNETFDSIHLANTNGGHINKN